MPIDYGKSMQKNLSQILYIWETKVFLVKCTFWGSNYHGISDFFYNYENLSFFFFTFQTKKFEATAFMFMKLVEYFRRPFCRC